MKMQMIQLFFFKDIYIYIYIYKSCFRNYIKNAWQNFVTVKYLTLAFNVANFYLSTGQDQQIMYFSLVWDDKALRNIQQFLSSWYQERG